MRWNIFLATSPIRKPRGTSVPEVSFSDLIPDSPPTRQAAGSVAALSRATNTVQGDVARSDTDTHMGIAGDGYFPRRGAIWIWLTAYRYSPALAIIPGAATLNSTATAFLSTAPDITSKVFRLMRRRETRVVGCLRSSASATTFFRQRQRRNWICAPTLHSFR